MSLTVDLGLWTLDQYFYESVFDDDCVGFDGAGVGEAVAGAHVEAPAVPVALDGGAAALTVGQGRSLVRAEILYGMKLSADVVKGQFSSIQKLDGCAASRGYFFDTPNGNGATLSRRFFEVAEP